MREGMSRWRLRGRPGATVGLEACAEFNVLGLSFDVDFNRPALRLPSIGRLAEDNHDPVLWGMAGSWCRGRAATPQRVRPWVRLRRVSATVRVWSAASEVWLLKDSMDSSMPDRPETSSD